MGLRLILTGLAVWALFAIIRHLYRQHTASTEPPPKAVQDMVRCARCGVHLPKPEAIHDGNHFFCSEQHRIEGGDQDSETETRKSE